jgi:ribosome-binding factor A
MTEEGADLVNTDSKQKSLQQLMKSHPSLPELRKQNITHFLRLSSNRLLPVLHLTVIAKQRVIFSLQASLFYFIFSQFHDILVPYFGANISKKKKMLGLRLLLSKRMFTLPALQQQQSQIRVLKKAGNNSKPRKSGSFKRPPTRALRFQSDSLEKATALLDDSSVKVDRSKPINDRSKLLKPLEGKLNVAKVNENEDVALHGLYALQSQELQQILTDTLELIDFSKVLPNVGNPSEFIEIERVKLNPDCSHADTFWTSAILHDFYLTLIEKAEIDEEVHYSEKDLQKFLSKLISVNKFLQENDGKFRTAIIRKVNYKRVPKVVFHIDKQLLALIQELKYYLENDGE